MKAPDVIFTVIILSVTRDCHCKQGLPANTIQQGLDQVIRNVKLRLENIFSNPKPTTKTSRLIKTPIETILPESWLDYDFYLGDVPRDVEIQIEDLNRRWQDEINVEERETLGSSFKKTRLRKKVPSKRQRFHEKRQNASHNNVPESKIYFTQIIHRRPDNIVRETFSRRQKNPHQQHHHTTDILDNYSPFIYAELLKENETFVLVEDLSKNNESESVVVNEIEIYQEEDYDEASPTERNADSDLVTLEVAIEDTEESSNSTSDTFLPYIPLGGMDAEEDFEMTVIGDSEKEGAGASNNSFEFGDVIAFNGDEPGLFVTLKEEKWAFPVLILSGCLASVVVLYQCSVMFSLLSPLTFSSHTILLGK